MARYSDHDRAPIDAIVDQWREDCLILDGSLLFEGEHIWTAENVEELYNHFNLDLQEDPDRSFEEKFEAQLADTTKATNRLAAETVAVYLLFAINAINGPRKRELLNTILSWKGDALDDNIEVARAMDSGIGNPGQFFNNGRPFLVMYVVAFARRLKDLGEDERRDLLSDAWRFKEWLVEEDGGEQMMRHILLHLLFPDEFERIASATHKYRIRDQLIGLVEANDSEGADAESEDDVDRQLFAIRTKITELMPDGQGGDGHIDFYQSPLREAWDPGDLDEPDAGAGISNLDALEFKRQVVLFGPPGTGKTFEAKDLARRLLYHQALQRWGPVPYLRDTADIDDAIEGQVRRLQLHQAYSYEDFIRGLRLTNDGTVPVDGYLLQLVKSIKEVDHSDSDREALPWVLILDEINRTDVSRLFGELFSLLEDRDETIDLPALEEGQETRSVSLPADLFFIGTMNLIDQSVEQLDFALRRRFLWLQTGFERDLIPPVVEKKWNELGEKHDTEARVRHNPWKRFSDEVDLLADRAAELNREIADSNVLGAQYEIGHTYFFDIAGLIARWPRVRPKGQRPRTYLWHQGKPRPPLRDLWLHSLEPLLTEYLGGIDTDMRKSELARLRDVLFRPPE